MSLEKSFLSSAGFVMESCGLSKKQEKAS